MAGKLIAFEGLDGSGITTQATELASRSGEIAPRTRISIPRTCAAIVAPEFARVVFMDGLFGRRTPQFGGLLRKGSELVE